MMPQHTVTPSPSNISFGSNVAPWTLDQRIMSTAPRQPHSQGGRQQQQQQQQHRPPSNSNSHAMPPQSNGSQPLPPRFVPGKGIFDRTSHMTPAAKNPLGGLFKQPKADDDFYTPQLGGPVSQRERPNPSTQSQQPTTQQGKGPPPPSSYPQAPQEHVQKIPHSPQPPLPTAPPPMTPPVSGMYGQGTPQPVSYSTGMPQNQHPPPSASGLYNGSGYHGAMPPMSSQQLPLMHNTSYGSQPSPYYGSPSAGPGMPQTSTPMMHNGVHPQQPAPGSAYPQMQQQQQPYPNPSISYPYPNGIPPQHPPYMSQAPPSLPQGPMQTQAAGHMLSTGMSNLSISQQQAMAPHMIPQGMHQAASPMQWQHLQGQPGGYTMHGHNPAGPLHNQTASIKLEIWCKGLRDRDVVGKSDPVAIVYVEKSNVYSSNGPVGAEAELMQTAAATAEIEEQRLMGRSTSVSSGGIGVDAANGPINGLKKRRSAMGGMNRARQSAEHSKRDAARWREVGRTEAIKNNLNPHFNTQIRLDYFFEEMQIIKIALWDVDTRSNALNDKNHDFLGEAEMTIADVISKGVYIADLRGRGLIDKQLLSKRERNWGKVFVRAHEERTEDAKRVILQMSGRKLPRKDMWPGKSDPYFVIKRIIDDSSSGQNNTSTSINSADKQSRTLLYRSEYIPRELNPDWKTAQFSLNWPKGGKEEDVKIEIAVYDHDLIGRNDYIGTARTTIRELEQGTQFELVDERKLKKKKRSFLKRTEKSPGWLIKRRFKMSSLPSFFAYLQGGLKLHFSVAIDFTLSNKYPNDPNSLHYMSHTQTNMYTQAITAVGNVLAPYSHDNRYFALGFGAQLPPSDHVSMAFSLSGDQDAHVMGVNGILTAYRHCLSSVRLSGPTNFTPIISRVMEQCTKNASSQDDQHYNVLLILTDGNITDMPSTVETVIRASSMPLSIIIVGIGSADFTRMNRLDGDNERLMSDDGRRVAERDIVQFVEFNKFAHRSPDRLAAQLLAELPRNVVDYFYNRNIVPNRPGSLPNGQDRTQY